MDANANLPVNGTILLTKLVRVLAVAGELCAEPLPTPGMIELAARAVGIATRITAELILDADAGSRSAP